MQFGKVSCGSTMRTHDSYDARDSYERARDAMGDNVCNGYDDIDSNGRMIPRDTVRCCSHHKKLN